MNQEIIKEIENQDYEKITVQLEKFLKEQLFIRTTGYGL